MAADPLDRIAELCHEQPEGALTKIAAVLGMDKVEAQRDQLRALWLEWLEGIYDGPDLLRRVKLAVYGPLRKPALGVPAAPARSCATCANHGDGKRIPGVIGTPCDNCAPPPRLSNWTPAPGVIASAGSKPQ